jgi:hypothetical protein
MSLGLEIPEKRFERGERRFVTLTVWLNSGDDFVLSNPKFELLINSRVEDSGDCSMTKADKGYDLTAMVEPKQRGRYTLIYTFGVGMEIRKKRVIIEVV